MDYKKIETKGITYINRVPGTEKWYWGMDYTDGDLYEAEELFNFGNSITHNRLIFVSYPEGTVYEPMTVRDGQYLGKPVFWEDSIYFLLVDFKSRDIFIFKCEDDMMSASMYTRVALDEVKDCYNLMLEISPLTLVRQGSENRFQVVWPDKGNFEIDPEESFDSRDGDKLIFSKWFEDPDYREETIIREYPTGEKREQFRGSILEMPDGRKWVLE